MNKLISRKNSYNIKTLQAYCSCNANSCYCASKSVSEGNYTSTSDNTYNTQRNK